ncbi:MAG: two-component system, sensor histidine kinase and response regulator [Gaiellaceae bacterium]|nr:two-component system, sensor histidine kinase and response regulator [Gaiellaceae bacterium]
MRTSKAPKELTRIVILSVIAVAVIAGVLTATVTNYRSALAAHGVVADSIFERSNSHAAETHLAREREAMNEYLLNPRRSVRAEVDKQSVSFRNSISKVGVGEPLESWFVRRIIAANNEFLTTFATGSRRHPKGIEELRPLELQLDRGEHEIMSPLNSLRSLNAVYARNVKQSADAASRRAILFAIIAGSLAIFSVLAFAVYAGRLVRSIGSRNERLRELDRLKDDFVASVSHELRTPLTSIRGYLELLRDGEAGRLTEGQGVFVEILERNANRLMRLVGDLLLVAQIEAGEVALERAPTEVEELVREAADAARPAAVHEGIELDLDFDAGIGELYADRARLGQVLDNLISNALKFTERGGHVGVRTFRRDDALVVEVSDTGMGMTKEDVGQLFQRFFRTASATEQAIQGTGLGLAIVKAIVEAHGGVISVVSVLGRGTTFRVELPLARQLLAA